MITVTIYNSKDNEQKKFCKVTWKLAMTVLDRIQGKNGWWAKAEHDDGDRDILHWVNDGWVS